MVKRNCRDELMEFRGGPAEIRHRYGTRSQAGEELAEARIFGPPIEEAIGSRDAAGYVAPRKKPCGGGTYKPCSIIYAHCNRTL
jgi:hypothetical protein